MSDEHAKDEEPGDEPKHEPTLPGVGDKAPRVGFDPNAPPVRPPMPTMIGVGEEASPAHLRTLAIESSSTVLEVPRIFGPPAPEPAPEEVSVSISASQSAPAPPLPANRDAAPAIAPREAAAPPLPPRVPRAIPPPGGTRSGIASKLIVLLFIGGGIIAYLHRDEIMQHISPTAPPTTMAAEPAGSVAPSVEEAGAIPALDGSSDASSAELATAKVVSAKDAGADAATKGAGAKDGGAKDGGARAKTDGGAKAPKPAPKPPPPTLTADPTSTPPF